MSRAVTPVRVRSGSSNLSTHTPWPYTREVKGSACKADVRRFDSDCGFDLLSAVETQLKVEVMIGVDIATMQPAVLRGGRWA